jgi:hypothetical protein
MTRIGFALAFTIVGALNVCAQEAARSTVDLTTNTTGPTPTPIPAPAPALPDLPELSQLDEIFKQTSLGKTADEFRMRVEWRRLRNRVANDPEVVAARKASDASRTDLEKRERLRDYYRISYARMRALADKPEIKAALDGMQDDHLKLTAQDRVRPSPTPAESTSTAEPAEGEGEQTSPTPTPTPGRKHKHKHDKA